jgi:16S rRNA (uracil1498-N3)-methyltransferase
MKSFYIEEDLKVGKLFNLIGSEHNHLSKVLRSKVGEVVLVYNNTNFLFTCEIKDIKKEFTTLCVISREEAKTNPKSNLTLFVALLKGEKFEFLITKLTELGVSCIVPFESEFCTSKNVRDKETRQKQIAIDAIKQCKRTKLIEISKPLKFNEMLSSLNAFDKVLFAYEKDENHSLKDVLKEIKSNEKVAVIVGSEGGFSEKEAEEIVKSGAIQISLGNRILRAETACVALSTIVLNHLGEYEV